MVTALRKMRTLMNLGLNFSNSMLLSFKLLFLLNFEHVWEGSGVF